MESSQVAILEQKLNRVFKAAIWLHCVGAFIIFFLFYGEPSGYKQIGLVVSILSFIVCLFLQRHYFYAKQELNQLNRASSSAAKVLTEKFVFFIFPYTMWCPIIGLFLMANGYL